MLIDSLESLKNYSIENINLINIRLEKIENFIIETLPNRQIISAQISEQSKIIFNLDSYKDIHNNVKLNSKVISNILLSDQNRSKSLTKNFREKKILNQNLNKSKNDQTWNEILLNLKVKLFISFRKII